MITSCRIHYSKIELWDHRSEELVHNYERILHNYMFEFDSVLFITHKVSLQGSWVNTLYKDMIECKLF